MTMRSLELLSTRLFTILASGQDSTTSRTCLDVHAIALPKIAANHLAASLHVGAYANLSGFHAIALGLARQSLESLTVVELGLRNSPDSWALLKAWENEKKTAGSLRQWLAEQAWGCYGPGLLGEPWSDFMTGLGRALQPYAHFSPALLQWNLSLVATSKGGFPSLAGLGPGLVDHDKRARLGLVSCTESCCGRLHTLWPNTPFLPSKARCSALKSSPLDGS